MKNSAQEALRHAREKLGRFPPLLDSFNQIYDQAHKRDDVALLISGSLVKGEVSEFSDIDIQLVLGPQADPHEVRTWSKRLVSELGHLMACFPANHIGLPDLEVAFVERDGFVVKVDTWIMQPSALPMVAGSVAVHDPDDRVAQARASQTSSPFAPDYADLHHKFCGWMWFTYGKVQRGNLFEAIESLDFMRGYALMPLLHRHLGTPTEGYRHAEARLPKQYLDDLEQTYPRRHDAEEVTRAFWALVELFDKISSSLPDDVLGTRGGDLSRMAELIRSHLQASR